MATRVFYQTLNNLGIDPTVYYTGLATAGGSITPEYPAPPFLPGMRAFGSDGSEFIFVQASTSISLSDFVSINIGATSAPFQANSMTTTNLASSLIFGLGSTGLVLNQSVSFIPAQAYFWALTRGAFVPGGPSSFGLTTAATGGVQLFTSGTAGLVSSTSTSLPLLGIGVINSLTTGISASVCPPAGVGPQGLGLSTSGLTLGPVFNIWNLHTGTVDSGGTIASFTGNAITS